MAAKTHERFDAETGTDFQVFARLVGFDPPGC